MGCFVGGVPTQPVCRNQIRESHTGYEGRGSARGWKPRGGWKKGELVNSAAFPSQPLDFWGIATRSYHAACAARYPGLWHHGDFVEATARGRLHYPWPLGCDANPGGVRIGTAEIYRQIEAFNAVQKHWFVPRTGRATPVFCFLSGWRRGWCWMRGWKRRFAPAIRNGASPRHVPAKIIAVPDIPRTRSGKIVELAVREVVHSARLKIAMR